MESPVLAPGRASTGEPPHEASRIVFRPGPLQYLYTLFFPALLLFMAATLIAYGLGADTQDWDARIPWAIGMAAAGGLWAAYVLGMRIEVDDNNVSKVYLFGLLRSAIPRDRLHASSEFESNRGRTYTRVDFECVDDDDDVWGFSVYPSWVWRPSDVDKLRAIAARSEQGRAAHPVRSAAQWRPSIGTYLRSVAGSTYLCLFGAIAPVGALYQNWGGSAAIAGVVMFESGVILLAVLAVWSKRRRPALNTFAFSLLGLTAIFGFLAMVPEAFLMARSDSMAVLVGSGSVEAVSIFVAAVVTSRLTVRSATGARRRWRVVRSRTDTPRQIRDIVSDSEAPSSNPGPPSTFVVAPQTSSIARPTNSRDVFSDRTRSDESGYRWWQASFLLAVLAAGAVLLGLAVHDFSDAALLDAAGPCKADATSTTGCYQLVRATVVNDDFSCTEIGCSHGVNLQVGATSQRVTVWSETGQFSPGTVVGAKVYDGRITDVETGGENLWTDENPNQKANNLLWWGLGLTFFGGLPCIPVVMWLQRRRGTGSEAAWTVVLGVAALFFLVVGIASASSSHGWTTLWPLNVIGGVLAYVPLAVWVACAHRLPDSALVRWPARALAFVLTVIIPFAVWAPVPPPPS